MTLRAKLRETVAARLVPELKRRGFSGPDKIGGIAISHEFRRMTNGRDERLSVQFEKRQRPRFVLNIWVEPPGGVESLIDVGGTWIQGRVSQTKGAFTRSWFRADRPLWQRLIGKRTSREQEAVSQAIAYLAAIDDWYEHRRETDIVRVMTFTYPNALGKQPNHTLEGICQPADGLSKPSM